MKPQKPTGAPIKIMPPQTHTCTNLPNIKPTVPFAHPMDYDAVGYQKKKFQMLLNLYLKERTF